MREQCPFREKIDIDGVGYALFKIDSLLMRCHLSFRNDENVSKDLKDHAIEVNITLQNPAHINCGFHRDVQKRSELTLFR